MGSGRLHKGNLYVLPGAWRVLQERGEGAFSQRWSLGLFTNPQGGVLPPYSSSPYSSPAFFFFMGLMQFLAKPLFLKLVHPEGNMN